MGGKAKILFVDDDPEILATLKRTFRRKYLAETALGPLRGLEVAAEHGPYAVVVADLRMPGLDGLEFFTQLKKLSPETVRIMLTGYADLRAAMDAVNTGHVFRFLAKPCPEEELAESLAAGAALYAQATAERDFLKGALRGIIKLLSDLLALQNPEAFARAMRVRRLVADMARYLGAPDAWRIELAVTLSQLGGLVLPQDLFAKLRRTGDLAGDEARLFARHPGLAGDLLANIPKLDEVAAIIRHQETPHAGAGRDVPLGAKLLKAALDYDVLLTSGRARDQALDALAGREGLYDPQALDALTALAGEREGLERREIPLSALTPGMILEDDVALPHAAVLATSGQMVDAGWLACLEAESLPGDVRCRVLAPPAEDAPPPGLADPELLALLRRVGRAQGSP
ncbi:HD domain-containing phosphohydrolase [Solidesulfovibrio magneticus]|uniref:Response regulator receiver protein n=1 Tax=Solidesulfovibrio magneticus (strain ATCC 700980 / DSM 13731 / RS-1) TaxID=573370 RepID=C4XHC6_SOLM1|nr:HD domain-containing phosphohydrolase [Solidesulfovibrio magneticus]BAH73894.1 response regulator receiver protein [Solidesulfovibrio magneticus RS-1]